MTTALSDPFLCTCGSSDWGASRSPLMSAPPQPPQQHQQHQQGLKRDRDSHSSEYSELSTLPSVVAGDYGELSPGTERPALYRQQQEQHYLHHHQQQQRVSFADDRGHFELAASRSSSSTSTTTTTTSRAVASFMRSSAPAQAGRGNGSGGTISSRRSNRPTLSVCVDDEEAVGSHGGPGSNVNSLRSPASSGVRSPGTPSMTAGVGSAGRPRRVSCSTLLCTCSGLVMWNIPDCSHGIWVEVAAVCTPRKTEGA